MADVNAELARHHRELQQRESDYNEARDALNDRHSEVVSDLQQTQRRLNDLQTQYEQYAEADMPALERDINALPQWREQRDQLRTHPNVMQDAVKESQARLDGRLRELSEALARQTRESQELIDALVEEKALRREQQWESEQQLNERYQQERQRLEGEYQAQLELGVEQLAELKAHLSLSTQTAEEASEAELAQARLDQAQQERNASAATLDGLRREFESRKRERDSAEQQLVQLRQQLERAEQRCFALYQQRDPEQGSLRHFLRYHRPGWEQQLGKVIAPGCWSGVPSPRNWQKARALICSGWRWIFPPLPCQITPRMKPACWPPSKKRTPPSAGCRPRAKPPKNRSNSITSECSRPMKPRIRAAWPPSAPSRKSSLR